MQTASKITRNIVAQGAREYRAAVIGAAGGIGKIYYIYINKQ